MDFVSLTPLEDDLLGPIGMESPSLMTTNRLIRTTSICTSMLLGAFYNERWFAAEWPLELTNECQKFRSSTPHADTFPWHSTRKSCANTPDHEQPITLYTFFLLNSLEKLPLLHNQYDITFLPFDLITLTSFIVFYRISSQSSDMKLFKTNFIQKSLESQITHMNNNSSLEKYQSSFRTQHGRENALIKVTNDLLPTRKF